MIHVVKNRLASAVGETDPAVPAFWLVGPEDERGKFRRYTALLAADSLIRTDRHEDPRTFERVGALIKDLPHDLVREHAATLFMGLFEGDNPWQYHQTNGNADFYNEDSMDWRDHAGFEVTPYEGGLEPIYREAKDTVEWTPVQLQKAQEVGATVAIYQTLIDWDNPAMPDGRPVVHEKELSVHFGRIVGDGGEPSFKSLAQMPVTTE